MLCITPLKTRRKLKSDSNGSVSWDFFFLMFCLAARIETRPFLNKTSAVVIYVLSLRTVLLQAQEKKATANAPSKTMRWTASLSLPFLVHPGTAGHK